MQCFDFCRRLTHVVAQVPRLLCRRFCACVVLAVLATSFSLRADTGLRRITPTNVKMPIVPGAATEYTDDLKNYKTFEEWISTFSVDASERSADPDGDGASNYLEYLVGTKPNNASDGFRISISQ